MDKHVKTRCFRRLILDANGHTDGHLVGWTCGGTDRPSYRDARTLLKIQYPNQFPHS